jgi:NADH:ubiquinone oxidoreductase subunit K
MLSKLKIVFFFMATFIFFVSFLVLALSQKSLLIIMLTIELMYFSVILVFLSWSIVFVSIEGQVFSLLILGVVASDSVIGLSLIYLAYSRKRSITSINAYSVLKG